MDSNWYFSSNCATKMETTTVYTIPILEATCICIYSVKQEKNTPTLLSIDSHTEQSQHVIASVNFTLHLILCDVMGSHIAWVLAQFAQSCGLAIGSELACKNAQL